MSSPIDSGLLFTHQHCSEGHDHPFPFACDMYGNEYCDHCWFRDGEAVMLIPCGPDNCQVGGIKNGSESRR